ncbi:MAG: DUF1499 domain-containing protein [Candidatus Omnitrophica bacterium]|nr:DUF1499 domain-containing protein [Candidatus Omnitrophota bacterium]
MRSAKLSAVIPLLLLTAGCAAFNPKETGLLNGKLRPCPPAPKCVSSYYPSGIHHIAPLTYTTSKKEAYARLIAVIEGIEKSKIVTRTEDYIHAEFLVTSLEWVDVVEFLFEKDEKIIHFSSSASASVGYWDWGENKRRAKSVRALFNASQTP